MRRLALALGLFAGSALAADGDTGTLVEKVKGRIDNRTIEGLLVDSAAGSVAASTLAGIEGDALTVVENVRDLSLLANAFDPAAQGFGLAFTPARIRTPMPAIDLKSYRESLALRLVGAFTIGYAQGKTPIAGADWTRRSLSLATSAFLFADDDPVVVVAKAAVDGQKCSRAAFEQLPDDRPATSAAEAQRLVRLTVLEQRAAGGDANAKTQIAALRQKAGAGDAQAARDLEVVDQATVDRLADAGDRAAQLERTRRLRATVQRAPDAQEKAALDAFNACVDAALKVHAEKWNRTRFSIAWATGSAKLADGSGNSVSLGRTLALTALYGFDGVSWLKERAALTLMARRSENEPVLETLGPTPVTKNQTLVALRLAGGSSGFRLLAEASNAKDAEVTATQRTFRRALGADLRVAEGLWLNLRYGQQRRLDGSGNETGSFLVLNYSPSALLGR